MEKSIDLAQTVAEQSQQIAELSRQLGEARAALEERRERKSRLSRALNPRDIAAKKWVTLEWGEKWSRPFGHPAENAMWFICGKSASGKSSFVMQLAKELTNYGSVLYMSYEEGVSQDFQRRMEYLRMWEVGSRFKVAVEDSYEDLIERLKRPKSAQFVVVDSFQESGWHDYPKARDLVRMFPRKSFIFVSQEWKGQPAGKPSGHLRHLASMKVWVSGYKAYCQGRATSEAGSYYTVWEEGIIKTSNNI